MVRLFFLFAFSFIFSSQVLAGGPKRFSSVMTENGVLYFIEPMKMHTYDGCASKKDMLFDITYLTNDDDSVSFTTTVITENITKLDSVCIHMGEKTIKTNTEFIYCDPDGSRYVNRIRFYIKWTEWKELYEYPQPYIVDFGNNLYFAFKPKKWEKERKEIMQIINIIELNKTQR
ncbi:MAG: hypothetical protein IJ527_07465 [Prevotella sp.]|nr:hypothetical protein [Prevotella sp.]